ncbi:MAG TPA: c-type cytochrome [Labilithrix sp.]
MKYVYIAIVFVVACGTKTDVEVDHGTAVDHGRALFSDSKASPSVSNAFACATCHPSETIEARIFPGGALGGATKRATFWGGQRDDLLEAVNDCRTSFMDAPTPWTSDDPEAQAIYAYLASLPGDGSPVAFTPLVREADLPPGDAERGKTTYGLACAACHGTVHDGVGRIASFVPRLPDDVDAQHMGLALADRRNVYLRKAREGAFRDASGSMPPFSREALPDGALADVLVFLGQY